MVQDIATPMRQDAAAHKAKAAQSKLKLLEYAINGGDIELLSGIYQGRRVLEMFMCGSVERDYIVKNLCVLNDPEVLKIVGSMCGS